MPSRRISISVEGESGEEIRLTVDAEYVDTQVILRLWPTEAGKGGSSRELRGQSRLKRAAEWLFEADVASLWALKAGRSLEVSVPLHSEPAGLPTVGSVLRPLFVRPDLDIHLMPHQRIGVARLIKSGRLVLADDMGLGKTLQVLAALRILIGAGRVRRALVVCPASLKDVWISEASKWTPDLLAITFPGGSDGPLDPSVRLGHLHIVNYERLRGDLTEIQRLSYAAHVFDEAHRIKAWDSLQSQGARSLTANRIWALSGTPLEKGHDDVVSLMSFLLPDRFSAEDTKLPSYLLRARLRPWVLRREKGEVFQERSKPIHRKLPVSLSAEQRRRYRETLRSRDGGSDLTTFNRLRELCDWDPDSQESSKADRICDLILQLQASHPEDKVVVFSYLLGPLYRVRDVLNAAGIGTLALTGETPVDERRSVLRRFARGKEPVLLCSLKVGGEGLTLTAANHVVLLNRWWNPSANEQAIDRVNRLGQTKPVSVYVLEAKDTVDEGLSRIIEEKEITFDEVVAKLRSGNLEGEVTRLLGTGLSGENREAGSDHG